MFKNFWNKLGISDKVILSIAVSLIVLPILFWLSCVILLMVWEYYYVLPMIYGIAWAILIVIFLIKKIIFK
jgi:hypothetical protein